MEQAITIGVSIVLSAISGGITASFIIGQYKNKVDNLEATIGKDEHGGLRKTVGDINIKVIACETSLKEREPYKKSKSPVSLTERGERALSDSGCKSFVDENYEELKKAVEDADPKTSYDVQEKSHDVAINLTEDSRINSIKDYAFKEGVKLEDLLDIMGIYLRDKILDHKHMKMEDIDKDDPNR